LQLDMVQGRRRTEQHEERQSRARGAALAADEDEHGCAGCAGCTLTRACLRCGGGVRGLGYLAGEEITVDGQVALHLVRKVTCNSKGPRADGWGSAIHAVAARCWQR